MRANTQPQTKKHKDYCGVVHNIGKISCRANIQVQKILSYMESSNSYMFKMRNWWLRASIFFSDRDLLEGKPRCLNRAVFLCTALEYIRAYCLYTVFCVKTLEKAARIIHQKSVRIWRWSVTQSRDSGLLHRLLHDLICELCVLRYNAC